jgi:hypothetical protein
MFDPQPIAKLIRTAREHTARPEVIDSPSSGYCPIIILGLVFGLWEGGTQYVEDVTK